jgi:hypothetical protein
MYSQNAPAMKGYFYACPWSSQAWLLPTSARRSQPIEKLAQLPGTVFGARSLRRRRSRLCSLAWRCPFPSLRDRDRCPPNRSGQSLGNRDSTGRHDVRCPTESLSLLYLNPPYDWEAGSSNNQRLESVFLEHTYRWLKPGGVLVFVIPQLRLAKCARLLSEEFQDLGIYRLTEPVCPEYKQIVVLGTRRKRHATLTDSALIEKARWLEGLATKPHLEPLGEYPETRYEVPCSGPLVLTHVGIPLDEVEDLLLDSAAYRQASRIFLPKQRDVRGRPLTPLHGGHVGLLCTAGMLNGIFDEGEGVPIFHWFAQFARQEHASRDDLWLSGVRVLKHGIFGRLHTCNNVAIVSPPKSEASRDRAMLRAGTRTVKLVLTPIIFRASLSKTKASTECQNRLGPGGTVIAIESEPEPRTFWITRNLILMTSVSMSIRCTSVRIISRRRCQSALTNSGPMAPASSRSRFACSRADFCTLISLAGRAQG